MSALNPRMGDYDDILEAYHLRFKVFEKLLSRSCFNAAFNALTLSFVLFEEAIELERTNDNGTEKN